MSCRELFEAACGKKMNCPIKIVSSCHPKAHLDVFADHRNHTITLVCGQCDQTITTIRIKPQKKGKK